MSLTPHFSSKSRARAPKHGFTLVEILAVVTIIAILTTITLGIAKSVSTRQALARANGDLAAIASGLELYKATYGDYIATTGVYTNPSDMRTPGNSEKNLTRALMGNYYIILPSSTSKPSAYVFSISSKIATSSQRAFVAPEAFRYSNGTSLYDGSNTSISIVDPWNNPYAYRYKQSCTASKPAGMSEFYWFSKWVSPTYILMSLGPDGTATLARRGAYNFTGSMSTTGIIPENYRTASYSMDNIIYGRAN